MERASLHHSRGTRTRRRSYSSLHSASESSLQIYGEYRLGHKARYMYWA
jgi:hypothetical protein